MTSDKRLSVWRGWQGWEGGQRVPAWRRRSLSSAWERLSEKHAGGGLRKQLTVGTELSPAPNSCVEADLRM